MNLWLKNLQTRLGKRLRKKGTKRKAIGLPFIFAKKEQARARL
jgi:hypothetical protein